MANQEVVDHQSAQGWVTGPFQYTGHWLSVYRPVTHHPSRLAITHQLVGGGSILALVSTLLDPVSTSRWGFQRVTQHLVINERHSGSLRATLDPVSDTRTSKSDTRHTRPNRTSKSETRASQQRVRHQPAITHSIRLCQNDTGTSQSKERHSRSQHAAHPHVIVGAWTRASCHMVAWA